MSNENINRRGKNNSAFGKLSIQNVFLGFGIFTLGIAIYLGLALQSYHLFVLNAIEVSTFDEVSNTIATMKFVIPAFFAIYSLIIFVFAWGVRKQLATERKIVIAQIQRLAKGELSQERKVRENDELSEVIEELNKLIPLMNSKS